MPSWIVQVLAWTNTIAQTWTLNWIQTVQECQVGLYIPLALDQHHCLNFYTELDADCVRIPSWELHMVFALDQHYCSSVNTELDAGGVRMPSWIVHSSYWYQQHETWNNDVTDNFLTKVIIPPKLLWNSISQSTI